MPGPKLPSKLLPPVKLSVHNAVRNASTQSLIHPPPYSQTQSSLSDPDTTPRTSAQSNANMARLIKHEKMPPPLSIMSLTSLLRSIALNSISCSPILLPPSLKLMEILAYSNSRFLNPDRNPILRALLKHTFYAQFCAGENAMEVKKTVDGLKKMGFKGVMLNYAKEEVLDAGALARLEKGIDSNAAEEANRKEILPWKEGTLKTVEITAPGEFVAIKFTGAGSQALYSLKKHMMPSIALDAAITEVFDLAAARGVLLLIDAEQVSLQSGVDIWTVHYMRKYNDLKANKFTVYNTYQCYLKSTVTTIASHLALARAEGWTLGAKLVRGAYLGSDPREAICDTIEDTHRQYDGIAEALMRREYNNVLKPSSEAKDVTFPAVNMVLAGHNLESARKGMKIRSQQAAEGRQRTKMVYAQLQGMADEVSCELLQVANAAKELPMAEQAKVDIPEAYKYLVWGSTGECMKYLLRRAQENKDAVGRTKIGRDAMIGEVVRRVRSSFGLV